MRVAKEVCSLKLGDWEFRGWGSSVDSDCVRIVFSTARLMRALSSSLAQENLKSEIMHANLHSRPTTHGPGMRTHRLDSHLCLLHTKDVPSKPLSGVTHISYTFSLAVSSLELEGICLAKDSRATEPVSPLGCGYLMIGAGSERSHYLVVCSLTRPLTSHSIAGYSSNISFRKRLRVQHWVLRTLFFNGRFRRELSNSPSVKRQGSRPAASKT